MHSQPISGKRISLLPFTSLLLASSLACLFALAQAPSNVEQATPTLRVDVDLVTLTATVFDASGRPVPNLKKEDFLIYEDGISQDIALFHDDEKIPVSVGIVFDTSGSMVDKIDGVKDAVIHFIETTNREDDIFVMEFSTQVLLVQDFTGDRGRLRGAIGHLRAGGSTALYDAIAKGLGFIQNGRHKKKALVVITDGNDTSSQLSLEEAVDVALRSEVTIYCLGIGHGERGIFGHEEGFFKDTVDVGVLRRFSKLTGGKTFLPEGAHYKRGVDQIDQACQEVSTELRQQYTLGYYPKNKAKDGKYREIRVKTKSGDFKVRTRDGYFASPASPPAPP